MAKSKRGPKGKRTKRAVKQTAATGQSHAAQPQAKPQDDASPYKVAYKALGLDEREKEASPSPIKQTRSWKLLLPSIKLWWDNRAVSLVLLILPIAGITAGALLVRDINTISSQTMTGLLLIILSYIWLIINVPASYYLQVQVVRGNHPSLLECYRHSLRFVLRLIGLTGLVLTLTIGGLLLLVIPGIIVIRRYILSPYYLIDQDLGIREAMRRSAADSKPVALDIWGVYAVFVAINLMAVFTVGQTFKPFGSLLAAIMSSLYVFGPALRYKEVALRQPAIRGIFEQEDR